jgi:hypothetical protein
MNGFNSDTFGTARYEAALQSLGPNVNEVVSRRLVLLTGRIPTTLLALAIPTVLMPFAQTLM